MNQIKKQQEKEILELFLKSNFLGVKLLGEGEARDVFRNYNGENPDFICFDGQKYIGIELFRLILRKTRGNIRGFANLAERQSKFPKIINNDEDFNNYLTASRKYGGVARQDDIAEVLAQEIPDKVNKLSLYCTEEVWLLGYSNESYQIGMVEYIKQDNIEDALRKQIFAGVAVPERIEKIILFETGTSPKDYVFYLK